jgi:uncharacterized BrkB/YihY/UPF0761 family membrane protein
LWVYFSVFVFVICAEMLSVLSHSNSQGHRASYLPFRKAGK